MVTHNHNDDSLSLEDRKRLLEAAARVAAITEKVNEGRKMWEAGEYDAAHKFAKALASAHDDNVGALTLFAAISMEIGHTGEAREKLERATSLAPDHPGILSLMGSLLLKEGKLEEAVPVLKRAIARVSKNPDTWQNLGLAYERMGVRDKAMEAYEKALDIMPNHVRARMGIGNLVIKTDPKRTEELARAIIAEYPGERGAHNLLGLALSAQGDSQNAAKHFAEMLERDPENFDVLTNMGSFLMERLNLTDALSYYAKATVVGPTHPGGWVNLGNVLSALGKAAEAEDAYRRVPMGHPQFKTNASAVLFNLNYRNDVTLQDVARAHRDWAKFHVDPALSERAFPVPAPRAGRKLKLAYVSADLREHSVASFMESLLESHDRDAFEIHIYNQSIKSDHVTERLKGLVDAWTDSVELSDGQFCDRVRADGIDVLIDVSGHTNGNRLFAMGMRCAPLQLTGIGYANTSGITAMDGRITDVYAEPEGWNDAFYAEDLLRMPNGFSCYRPVEGAPEVAPLPADKNDVVTLSCFNNIAKISDDTIRLWGRILNEVPNTQLAVKWLNIHDKGMRNELMTRFRRAGVDYDRVVFVPGTKTRAEHLLAYHDVDISLDPFPYNGTTTTCEAMWMGVPVVTLAGRNQVSRMGVSLLSAAGVSELIADSEDAYVDIVRSLVEDRTRLRTYRETLRETVSNSPLVSGPTITADLEAQILGLWDRRAAAGWTERTSNIPDDEEALTFTLPDGATAVVPGDLTNMTSYVLTEQGDWFEDDIRFIREFLPEHAQVLDIGANHGLFTVSMAKKVGPEGKVWAFEPAQSTADWLRRSIAANTSDAGTLNVEVVQAALSNKTGTANLFTGQNSELNTLTASDAQIGAGSEEVELKTLSSWAKEAGSPRIDFIKLDAEGEEVRILEGADDFFAYADPVVMFERRHGAFVNEGLLEAFTDRGFGVYHLVPGLGVLEPTVDAAALDDTVLNLYAISPAVAKGLAASGWLVASAVVPSDEDADVLPNAWRPYLVPRAFSTELHDRWAHFLTANAEQPLAHAYQRALTLACEALLPVGDAAVLAKPTRLVKLRAAHVLLEQLTEVLEEDVACHLTRARVELALGNRGAAYHMYDIAAALLRGKVGSFPQAPFLPPMDEDMVSPEGDVALYHWLRAHTLAARERVHGFSTFFTGNASLPAHEDMKHHGHLPDDMARRWAAMCSRPRFR